MSEPPVIQAAPLTSPNGEPLIPPKFVPLVMALGGVLVTGIQTFQASLVPGSWQASLCNFVSLTVVGILGAISPGWRK